MVTGSPETGSPGRAATGVVPFAVRFATASLCILAIVQGSLLVGFGRPGHAVIGISVAVATTFLAFAPVDNRRRLSGLALLAVLALANSIAYLTTGTEPTRGSSQMSEPTPPQWELSSHHHGSLARLIPPQGPAGDQIRVEIDRAEVPTPWHIQVSYSGLRVRGGVRYIVAFRARADRRRRISYGVSQAHAPWNHLGWYHDLEVGSAWRDYVEAFTATETDDQARVIFDLGAGVDAVEIAAVELRDIRTGASAHAPASAAH